MKKDKKNLNQIWDIIETGIAGACKEAKKSNEAKCPVCHNPLDKDDNPERDYGCAECNTTWSVDEVEEANLYEKLLEEWRYSMVEILRNYIKNEDELELVVKEIEKETKEAHCF